MARKDLIPFNRLTEEEQKKLAIKGGHASGEARRKKRDLKEKLAVALEYITSEKIKQTPDKKLKSIIKNIGYDVYVLLKEIEGGNLQAIDRAWDRLYGKPLQVSEDRTPQEIKTIELRVINQKNESEINNNLGNGEESKQSSQDNN